MPVDWRAALLEAWELSGEHPTIAEAYSEAMRWRDLRYALHPYLSCTCDSFIVKEIRMRPFPWSRTLRLVRTVRPNAPCTVVFDLANSGSSPSWNCFVEVREKPGDRVLASAVTWVMPQDTREIVFEVQAGEQGTRLFAVCYDPIFDPLDPDEIPERQSAPLAMVGLAQRQPASIHSRSNTDFARTMHSFINTDHFIPR